MAEVTARATAKPPARATRARRRAPVMECARALKADRCLFREIPKRGFNNIFAKTVAAVNVSLLNRFEDGATVDTAALVKAGLVKGAFDSVKILGNGDLSKKLTVQVSAFSEGAKQKIEAAGGKTEVI